MVREVAVNEVCLKWDVNAQWHKSPPGNLGTFILIRLRVSSLAKGHAVWRNGGRRDEECCRQRCMGKARAWER